MYSFEPNEEQQMLLEAVGRYAENDMRPAGHNADEECVLPETVINKGWELGVLQASVPEEYGGFGEHSAVTSVLAAEEMAFGDLAGTLVVNVPSLFVMPILLAGSEDQKKEFIPPVIEMDWLPYTAALIEYTLDFDPLELKTTAKVEGDSYVLDGVKAFVPYAREARAMIVYANLDGNTQGFIVPQGVEGLSIGEEKEKLMSLNALPTYRVKLEGVKIAKENRLGGDYGHDFQPVLASMRVTLAAMAVGVANAAFAYSRDYAKEREVFGVKVAQKQAIAFMLAEMATEIEAVRMLTWEAAWKLDTNADDAIKHAYLAATGAADMAMMVTDRAVQILGGYGYIREFPVEMWMRNGRGFAMLLGLAIL
jgi:alkylation response protein AidB-like acyl-CoA dehydrogenase